MCVHRYPFGIRESTFKSQMVEHRVSAFYETIQILFWWVTHNDLHPLIIIWSANNEPRNRCEALIIDTKWNSFTSEQKEMARWWEEGFKFNFLLLLTARHPINSIQFNFGDDLLLSVSHVIKGSIELNVKLLWCFHNPDYVLVIIAVENIKHIRSRLNDQILFLANENRSPSHGCLSPLLKINEHIVFWTRSGPSLIESSSECLW